MKKICGLITFINFICSTTKNNKRKCPDNIASNHNQDDTVGLRTLLVNEKLYFVLKDLEQYKNEPKRSKFSDRDFDYEDFSEFLNSTGSQKPPEDKINGDQIENMDPDGLNQNNTLLNIATLIEQSDDFKKPNEPLKEVPKQGSNYEQTDKKTEGILNLDCKFSGAAGPFNNFRSNDENVEKLSNTPSDFIEIIDFSNELIMALKIIFCNFIIENIGISYRMWHLNRIENLDMDFAIISKYKLDEKFYSEVYNPLYDKQLLKELKYLNVDKLLSFNQETYKQVEGLIMKEIFSTAEAGFVREKLFKLSDDHKKVFFYHEFFKLYEHAVDIPELLTLGGLYKEKFFPTVCFLLHIINLAAKSVDKIENIRVFILCIISIVFENTNNFKFDIFKIQEYNVPCKDNLHNLHYLTYEFCSTKRYKIKYRKFENLYVHFSDKFVVKAVIVCLFFQHMLYMVTNNYSVEQILCFKDFALKVIESDNCNGCLFEEFSGQIKKLKS